MRSAYMALHSSLDLRTSHLSRWQRIFLWLSAEQDDGRDGRRRCGRAARPCAYLPRARQVLRRTAAAHLINRRKKVSQPLNKLCNSQVPCTLVHHAHLRSTRYPAECTAGKPSSVPHASNSASLPSLYVLLAWTHAHRAVRSALGATGESSALKTKHPVRLHAGKLVPKFRPSRDWQASESPLRQLRCYGKARMCACEGACPSSETPSSRVQAYMQPYC